MTVWSRLAAKLVKLPPPQTTAVSVERDLAAKMPDGAVLLADRWYPTEDVGRTADRVGPHAVRADPDGTAGPSVRGARVPDGDPELPRHVRLGRRVGARPPRAERRARHARMGGVPALVRRPARHVGCQLSGDDAVGDRRGPAGLRESAQPSSHGSEFPRRRHLSGRSVRSRDGARVDLRDQAPGAESPDRSPYPASGQPCVDRGAPTCCRWESAMSPPSASSRRLSRTGSSTAPPATPGGRNSISDDGTTRSRRPASSAGGTTSSWLGRSPTTRLCARPGARRASPSDRGRTPVPASSASRSGTVSIGSTSN